MRRTRENELSYIDGIIRGVGEKMWRGRRKGDGSIGKVIGDKEGGIVGMLADSLVPIHPVFSIRPSFSCPTKFTTRFSFLTIAPLPFFCGILGKISMHDGRLISSAAPLSRRNERSREWKFRARFIPPPSFHFVSMILFPRVSSMSRIFLFFLFCLRFFSEILLFFFVV